MDDPNSMQDISANTNKAYEILHEIQKAGYVSEEV